MTEPPAEFPSRAEIRAKAVEISEQLTLAAAAGQNPRQLSIDLLDEQANYAASLGDENVDRYLNMLSQEMEAINGAGDDRQRLVDEKKLGTGATLLGIAFGAMIGLPFLFRACS